MAVGREVHSATTVSRVLGATTDDVIAVAVLGGRPHDDRATTRPPLG
jgi:hypothetical protein